MAVLYRKYRPQTFSEVVGQESIVQTLKNQVKTGQVAHAYLFTGSRGIGKTTVARLLAKAVNCPKVKDGEPCGTCNVCEQIANNNFLDLVEIDAASNTGVDNIRELIEHIKFSPTVGKYKVFIIDEVHMLSKGAFNALLKTLEEPPVHSIFILATTEIHKVPATIISRTQRFDFKRLTSQQLEDHLGSIIKKEKLAVPHEVVSLIVRLAEGGGRDALSMLDKVSGLGNSLDISLAERLLGITDVSVSQKLLDIIISARSSELPAYFDNLMAGSTDLFVFNRDLLEYLRKVLVCKVTGSSDNLDIGKEYKEAIIAQAGKLTVAELLLVTRLFLRSYKELPGSPSPDLPLLLAALESCQRGSHAAPAVKQQATPQVSQVQPSPKLVSKETPKQESVERVEEAVEVPAVSVVTEEPGMMEDSNDVIAKEEIEKVWEQVADAIRVTNGPLAHLVRNALIQDCSPGKIVLGVKYLFHKQNLESTKNQIIISNVLEKICGKKLRVFGSVMKEEKPEIANNGEVLSDALQIFGGELVE